MVITADVNEIQSATDYIQSTLKEKKVKSKVIAKTVLSAEEMILTMIEHADSPNTKINIGIYSLLGNSKIRMTGRGRAFELSDIGSSYLFKSDDDNDEIYPYMQKLKNFVLSDNMTVKNKSGVNIATLTVQKSKYLQLFLTIGALIAGLLAGFIMKSALPENICSAVTVNLFSPVTSIFLNALKMVVAPLVMFSIASSIADYGDLHSLGRIAGKVLGSYLLTSVVAIGVGLAVWYMIPIGDPELQNAVTDAASGTLAKASGVSTSIKDTIVGIVPTDIVSPFQNADMLQIIFIAAMIGIAAGSVSDKLHSFKDVLNDCYTVFSKITAIIIGFMPAAIFCSMAKMMISMKTDTLSSVLTWIPVIYLGDIIMLCFYGVLIAVFGHLNPLTFYKKFYPVMLTGFTFASSNSTLPASLDVCENKLGISKRICSFSLPLGATVNMDGNCVTLMISSLFMAKIFNVDINSSMILTLIISIFVLSVGAPGVPGGALVCISLLLPQIGISAEAISIIMGLYSIVGMMQVCTNVTGDAVVTLIAAKSEKMLVLEKFNS